MPKLLFSLFLFFSALVLAPAGASAQTEFCFWKADAASCITGTVCESLGLMPERSCQEQCTLIGQGRPEGQCTPDICNNVTEPACVPVTTPVPTPSTGVCPPPPDFYCYTYPDQCTNSGGTVRPDFRCPYDSAPVCCFRSASSSPPPTPLPSRTPTPTPVIGCVRAAYNACSRIYECQSLSGYYSCPYNPAFCCQDPGYCFLAPAPPTPTPDPNLSLPRCTSDSQCQQDFQDNGVFDAYCSCSLGTTSRPFQCANIDSHPFCTDASGTPVAVYTGLGCLPFSALSLATLLLPWAVGLSGGIVFLILIYAAFILATSAGDPQRLASGRQLFTSALTGLLLIALSVVLLNFLGVNILGLGQLGFNV